MTIPSKLVQAAAEALWEDGNNRIGYRPWEAVKDAYMAEAGHAIAAAFAALPGCEDVIMAVAEAMPHGWTDDDGIRHDDVSRGNYNTAKAYLAALAREFGEADRG